MKSFASHVSALLPVAAVLALLVPLFGTEVLQASDRREGPALRNDREVVPVLKDIPADRVLVTFHEGLPAHDRWLKAGEVVPAETMSWQTASFLLPRLPARYDDWGIRQAWKAPVLVRAAARVKLSPGKHRFLVRTRGLSRLWVHDQVIVRTRPHAGSSDGHDPVPAVPAPPLPGMRPSATATTRRLATLTSVRMAAAG